MRRGLVPLFTHLEQRADRFGPGARRVTERVLHRVERLLQLSDPLTPPRRLRNQVGPFDDPVHFREIGAGVLRHFIDLGLAPTHDVLDIGCGCGQIAVPLLGYATPAARYEGFDISDDLIDWCRAHLTTRRPSFRFRAFDLYNSYFRPHGRLHASALRFPYADASFDFAFAKSVFTHLLPADAENYLAQTARVLRPGGRAWFSFFLVDDAARARIAAGESSLDFRFPGDGYLSVERARPEHAVAYEEAHVRALLERHGLLPHGATTRGSWSGCSAAVYQDSIVVVRR
ncbi:MAG TPA: class I SAM-dependent methyltransferase [Polyangia bacterium]|jgi:SAM-dependent methyltransferase|nr:class I SAM-dependent methyltransferase [Polyangia bacterium]